MVFPTTFLLQKRCGPAAGNGRPSKSWRFREPENITKVNESRTAINLSAAEALRSSTRHSPPAVPGASETRRPSQESQILKTTFRFLLQKRCGAPAANDRRKSLALPARHKNMLSRTDNQTTRRPDELEVGRPSGRQPEPCTRIVQPPARETTRRQSDEITSQQRCASRTGGGLDGAGADPRAHS